MFLTFHATFFCVTTREKKNTEFISHSRKLQELKTIRGDEIIGIDSGTCKLPVNSFANYNWIIFSIKILRANIFFLLLCTRISYSFEKAAFIHWNSCKLAITIFHTHESSILYMKINDTHQTSTFSAYESILR